MAEINSGGGGSHKKGAGKPKTKKMSTRIDMTPMVDLGFLLITFFILTTTLITPQTMEIAVPSNKKDENPPKLKESLAITILLGKDDAVYYYFGVPNPAKGEEPEVHKSTYTEEGIEKMLKERNNYVVAMVDDLKNKFGNNKITEDEYKKQVNEAKKYKDAPMVLIKATEQSTYKNLVDILDEMNICSVGKYAIVDISAYDLKLLQKQGEQLAEQEIEQVNSL